jgi:hypothetical protein
MCSPAETRARPWYMIVGISATITPLTCGFLSERATTYQTVNGQILLPCVVHGPDSWRAEVVSRLIVATRPGGATLTRHPGAGHWTAEEDGTASTGCVARRA